MATELIAPITEDLRADDNRMDIVKGMEHLNLTDEVIGTGLNFELGDWAVLGQNGLEVSGGTGVGNTYPIWVGNDQLDSKATGKATIITNGGFRYRTTKFAAGSYVEGQNLTVKDLGGGVNLIPSAAGGGDAILCRVYKRPDSKGVMEITVLDR